MTDRDELPGLQRMLRSPARVTLSVVVPLYNEELVIDAMYERLSRVLKECVDSYEVVMVNDGSRDRTVELAHEICKRDRNIKLVNLSRNFGHQLAITAGMDRCSGDCVVIIDADLQDPPEVIPQMLSKWRDEGCQVVYGVRAKRKGETWFKARDGEDVLSHVAQDDGGEHPGRYRRFPSHGSQGAARIPEDARARALRARHGELGRLQAGRSGVRARGALRRRDQVSVQEDGEVRGGRHPVVLPGAPEGRVGLRAS